jgi:hypothetical protein
VEWERGIDGDRDIIPEIDGHLKNTTKILKWEYLLIFPYSIYFR